MKRHLELTTEIILHHNILLDYYNTLINFMSVTRKRLDRKHFIQKLQQVKFDWQGQPLKLTFGQTAKHNNSSHSRKSKQKTRQNKHLTQKEIISNKISRTRYQLDRSKESKQSKQSLPKSSQSYYLTKGKNKRSGSATDKYIDRHKSKELTATSNIINSTFQMQSIINSHKKKQSNFSSTIGSKYQGRTHLKTGGSPQKVSFNDELKLLIFKSEAVLERYKSKNEILQLQNRLYKRKYQQALKKIKYLQNRN